MRLNQFFIGILFSFLLACGIKGKPLPPLILEKEKQENQKNSKPPKANEKPNSTQRSFNES